MEVKASIDYSNFMLKNIHKNNAWNRFFHKKIFNKICQNKNI